MKSLAGKPLYLFLLPVFFFLHAWQKNFAPGLTGTVLTQILLYSGAALVLTSLFYWYYRSWSRAALPAFFLLAFNFFFGSIHDFLKSILPASSIFLRYVYIIPLVLALLLGVLILLKKNKKNLQPLSYFLNLLFGIFILIELAGLVPLLLQTPDGREKHLQNSFTKCDTCTRPDVYVIITDEYAGEKELKDIFGCNNNAFYEDLAQRGFQVARNTRSNYNATVYSMASLFQMNYIRLRGKEMVQHGDMLYCRYLINNSSTGRFFEGLGYDFHNCSYFDIQKKPRPLTNYYFYSKSRILSFETFLNRFGLDAGFNFFSEKRKTEIERNDFNNDEAADSLTRKVVLQNDPAPKFTYTHFARPHHPYFLDRNGNPQNIPDSIKGFDRIRTGYTEHLLYTNQRLLQLIDFILQHSKQPPVILLASDHGFRQFEKPADPKYYFMNLTAIHLPNRQYQAFYEGMSPVNTFRLILNAQFGQNLPLLKDSSQFLIEKAGW